MQSIHSVRRLIVFLCLAAILLAALTPAAYGLFFAILVPLWYFLALIVSVHIRRAAEGGNKRQFPFLPVVTPRPPPVA